ncbi:hypothetical protein AXG93_4643s1000 [Marchantia polymorpha subsp. ruderalis]|uniref:Uncharacterized protein n=1 Tax=Marchantia polymorpha subsp. ruderalis TaxID=1480154 RepID=A0A176W066_MARPO|nr:hypothetical protein AXG93_4643s1000 [Marchantia polymorpha subsp. ruderalis]
MCSNCQKQRHTAVECDQPPASRPTVRFVTPPTKDNVQVNQVDLSPDNNKQEEVWPEEEVMCGRVETRSSKRPKENIREVHKRDNEVSELLKEALRAKTPSENRKTSVPSANSLTTTREQRRVAATAQNPQYDVVEDLGNQRANISFNQLLEDNKTYIEEELEDN